LRQANDLSDANGSLGERTAFIEQLGKLKPAEVEAARMPRRRPFD
jgi:hypothetical protein